VALQNALGPLASEATLAAMRGDTPHRRAVASSAFITGTEATLTVAALRAELELTNPAGSGKLVIVRLATVTVKTGGSGDVRLLHNPTLTGVPTATIRHNLRLGGPAPAATARAGTLLYADLDAGLTSGRYRAGLNAPLNLALPVVVPPGNVWAIRYAGANADVVAITCHWTEEVDG
jgi:hypothetical protein